ncbi:hypothetical protein GJ744_002525 [Endocarpon pusillum]|uniref:Uncharacterized protein n=1 Tax=Endocarpon pusillum TaxID=364733 RepID=A0A8H7DZX6_9EURO|nr:hypothetical protein GJ744_002525 [Endocarpon pusillum]
MYTYYCKRISFGTLVRSLEDLKTGLVQRGLSDAAVGTASISKLSSKDSNRETCEFRMIQARRKHLEKQVPRTDYRCQTITSGSPYTLHIRKVPGQYVEAHSQWKYRFDCARKRIRNLDSNPWLKHLLGDKHDEIFNLKITDRPLSELSPRLHNNKSDLGQHFPGNKRKDSEHSGHEAADSTKRTKLDIVDLTSD